MNITLTRSIALRLWVVVVVAAALGLALLWLGLRLGMALLTIAVLAVPIAVVATGAALVRQKATVLPRWLMVLGGAGTVVGLAWLLTTPGAVPAILTLSIGVWLLVVGLIAAVASAAVR